MGYNKEAINEVSEKYGEIITECEDASDDLENNNDYWILMIFVLVLMQEHEHEKLWKNFREDIMHNNRFFPKSELLGKVDSVLEVVSEKLCAGTILYRAREYKNDDYLKNKEVVAIYEKLNELFPDLKVYLDDVIHI